MRKIVYTFFFFVAISSARAELVRNYMEGTRPLGMGGAFLAIADDHNAIWYNPAGLGFMKKTAFNLVDITLGIDSADTLNRFTQAVFTNDYNNFFGTDRQFNRFYVRPTFLTKYFGFSIYEAMNSYLDISNINTLSMNVDMYSFNDVGAIAAVGFPVLPHLSIGMSMRAFVRLGVDSTITAQSLLTQLALSQSTDVTGAVYSAISKTMGTGWALGTNLGALFRVPMPASYPEIKLAATVEDFTNTEFKEMGSTNVPAQMGQTINMGISVKHALPGERSLTFAVDLRRNFEAGIPFFKRLYGGIEYNAKYFGIRAGLYQAKPTAGISIDLLPHTKVLFSTYAPSLDNFIMGDAQRWYVGQLIIGLGSL